MEMVRIVHPEAGEADVPASAVPAWRSSGWELASEVEAARAAEATESDEQAPADGKTEQDSKPSRSRRRSTEESE
jgi:hypothetical protein